MQDEKKAVNTYMNFDLDADEIAERKELLIKELDTHDTYVADLDEVKKRYAGLINSSQTTIEKLRESIKTKMEFVKVDIYYNDPARGEKRIVREDNGESSVQDMTKDEMLNYAQLNIFTKS